MSQETTVGSWQAASGDVSRLILTEYDLSTFQMSDIAWETEKMVSEKCSFFGVNLTEAEYEIMKTNRVMICQTNNVLQSPTTTTVTMADLAEESEHQHILLL
ncbi:hypothetical protein DPMN_045223 [Dreissena polymorpha]|uniref:Uncharacterized protein n=1 Tax=Dreissena polymorpha TaxID=45954 RepID=A0A9D4D4N4_DREPO|nr:hypothetical protein DPMN_045223 [Dreissena polymorpha]